jgi:4-amino-4-deoxy-L-arabinose transferase-like glycosyltransferase
MRRSEKLWLIAAFSVAILVRIPGVFWGANFPSGWFGHHVDEYAHLVNAERIINPLVPPRWPPHPYPSGMAAHAAIPLIAWRAAHGEALSTTLPPPQVIITTGRVFGALYGAASVLMLYLLARRIFKHDTRIPLLAAWLMALGGLHVTQSHFFLADVPALFWLIAGLYLLWRETEDGGNHYLYAAAIAFGIAFGLKLSVFGLPSLGLVALLSAPRLARLFFSAMAFIAGFVIVNAGAYTTYDLIKTFGKGISDPWQFSRATSSLLYLIELPSVFSLPLVILAAGGLFLLVRHARAVDEWRDALRIGVLVILPFVLAAFFVVFKMDHFPRHLVTFTPWIALSGAWALARSSDRIRSRGIPHAVLPAVVYLYLAVFVYDGERVFLNDPRNYAAQWVMSHADTGGTISWTHHNWFPPRANLRYVEYPDQGRPDVIVVEMHTANHYLSGMGWKNSYPRDYRRIFDSKSQSRVDQLQALFRGTSEYRRVAQFSEGYFMPEYWIPDNLIGNRSRNYVAEVVIFQKAAVERAVR